jgi:hypothetical protein
VNEAFQLQIIGNALAKLADLLEGNLTAKNDALHAKIIVGIGGGIVEAVCLGGNVDFKFRGGFVYLRDRPMSETITASTPTE